MYQPNTHIMQPGVAENAINVQMPPPANHMIHSN